MRLRLLPITKDSWIFLRVKVVTAMLKFAALAVTAICVLGFPCADAWGQIESTVVPPLPSGLIFPPGELMAPSSPPIAVDQPLQTQILSDPVGQDASWIDQEVQNQPQYIPDSQFTGGSSNGLPSRGALWLSVERVFGNDKDSDALIGDARAPQSFNDRFVAVNLGALDGQHIGLPELNPSLVGQEIGNDDPVGIRLRAGFRTFNDGGLEFDGLWMEDNEAFWKRGLGGFNAGADPTTVRVTAALPLFDGDEGYAVPYDQYFRIGISTETNTYGLHMAPRGYWWGAILLQPTLSVRWIDLNERLGFAGADSGLSYQHNPDGTPVETTLDPPVAAVPPYQSTLNSAGTTSLVGPLLGLNYATTGRVVRFSGSTRVGVYYADTTQSLSGQGFGNAFVGGFVPTATFADSNSSNYGTAAFEQNINVDIDVLRMIPRFQASKPSSSLLLRLGWGIMAAHSVVRTVDSIAWNGFPLTPQIEAEKDLWYLQTWSVGALYQY